MKAVKMLLGCFRSGDANDPEVYTSAVVAVLSDYPLSVINEVIDPRNGLPSKVNFLPTIAEIKEECSTRYHRLVKETDSPKAAFRFLPPPPENFRAAKHPATRSGLCAQFGLDDIPAGWDAVEVTKMAARYGKDLPRIVSEAIQGQNVSATPKSVFGQIVENLKS